MSGLAPLSCMVSAHRRCSSSSISMRLWGQSGISMRIRLNTSGLVRSVLKSRNLCRPARSRSSREAIPPQHTFLAFHVNQGLCAFPHVVRAALGRHRSPRMCRRWAPPSSRSKVGVVYKCSLVFLVLLVVLRSVEYLYTIAGGGRGTPPAPKIAPRIHVDRASMTNSMCWVWGPTAALAPRCFSPWAGCCCWGSLAFRDPPRDLQRDPPGDTPRE
jgi:hypothetical protein